MVAMLCTAELMCAVKRPPEICAIVAAWMSVGQMHAQLGRAGQGRAGRGGAGQGRAGQILMRQQANIGRSRGAACICGWGSSHEVY